jgi:hypothetical protein
MSAPINPNLVLVGTVEARRTEGPERRYRITNGSLDNLQPGTYRLFAETSAASGERPTPESALRLARAALWGSLAEKCAAADAIAAALAAADAQAAESLTPDDIRNLVRDSGLDWHKGFGPSDGEPNRFEQLVRAAYRRGQMASAEPVEARKPLTPLQIADCATDIEPYPMELVCVPSEQFVAFARNIQAALGITPDVAGEPQTKEAV